MLKDRRTYEIMRPADVGVPSTHAGARQTLRTPRGANIAAKRIGHTLTRLELDQVYRRVIALCDAQKTITDDDLIAVIQEVRLLPAR